MGVMDRIERYGVLIVGLLIGGGFAFGGIASYSSMVGGGPSSGNNNQFNATVPSDNYQESSFGLSSREQDVLAVRNDIVFVTGVYSSQEEFEKLSKLRNLTSTFNNRMYVQLVNSSSTSDILIQYGVSSYPKVVVVGGARSNTRTAVLDDVSSEAVASAGCDAISNWRDLKAYCITK